MGPFGRMVLFGVPTFMECLMSLVFVEPGSIVLVHGKGFSRLGLTPPGPSLLDCEVNLTDGQIT